MAEQYSDEELVEQIKTWLKNNGPGIAVGVVIGLGAVFGWRFWQDHQRSQAEQASAYYDAFSEALSDDDIPKARGQAVVLLDDYPDTGYARLAALRLAKMAAEDGDNDEAIERLKWALAQSEDDPAMSDVIRLRLARLLVAEARYDDALEQLARIINASFTAEVEELRGDVYWAQKQLDKARDAYQAARAASGNSGSGSLLQMKLDGLQG